MFLLLAALLLAINCSQKIEPERKAGPVAVVTVKGQGGWDFALAPGTCVDKACKAQLQLLEASSGKVVDAMDLEFAASSRDLRREEGQSGLAIPATVAAFTAGSEEGAVTTALQGVSLGAEAGGVIVYQAGGFEHVKRRYDAFAALGGKLQRVWAREEGAGPVTSRLDVVSPGGPVELLYQYARPGDGNEQDEFHVEQMRWNAEAKKFEKQEKSSAPLVAAGAFASASKAREYAKAHDCFNSYWVIEAKALGLKKSARGYVLVKATGTRETAQAEIERECGGARLERRIVVGEP